MRNELRLPLKRKWFEMTKLKIKKEDYRELTPYWLCRLCYWNDETIFSDGHDVLAFLEELKNPLNDVILILKDYGIKFKNFSTNVMTLGYPKSTDESRILRLEHDGIEIREGNPEWGAETEKLYFVIKHRMLKTC